MITDSFSCLPTKLVKCLRPAVWWSLKEGPWAVQSDYDKRMKNEMKEKVTQKAGSWNTLWQQKSMCMWRLGCITFCFTCMHFKNHSAVIWHSTSSAPSAACTFSNSSPIKVNASCFNKLSGTSVSLFRKFAPFFRKLARTCTACNRNFVESVFFSGS